MDDISQQILAIEKEIRETPYHKGTEEHIGKLRARLARLRDELIEAQTPRRQGSGGSSGFALRKQGDATVVLVGPPSAGKSTLLNKLTNAQSRVAPYAFTTVSVIPGMMLYNNAYIQILDVPGLIEGAGRGKGRGKEVLSVARGADLLLVMTDVERIGHFEKMTTELEETGIRINKSMPEINIDKKPSGGIIIRSNIRQEITRGTIEEVAKEFRIRNAEITLSEKAGIDELIDALSQNRAYIPAIFVINKIDLKPKYESHLHDIYHISAESGVGLQELKEAIWQKLGLTKIYLLKKNKDPNFDNPIIMRQGNTLSDVAVKIGSEFAQRTKLAKIWGGPARFPGQEVPLTTKVNEGLQVRFM